VSSSRFRFAVACGLALAGAAAGAGEPAAAPSSRQAASQSVRHAKPRLDTSGRRRRGLASVYARKFDGRKMADGTIMDPRDDNAASKTLPLGTTAKVTNVETGQSAVVTIRDRGPHVPGRIIDLSPATASQLGISRREGVSHVEVTPLSLPPPDEGPH